MNMNTYLKRAIEKIASWSLTKKIIYGLLLLVVIFLIFLIVKPKDNSANITTDTVKNINLKETVLATGQVTSNTDLNLSFYSGGIVRTVKVKVGDNVKKGQILATLDQGNELAALTQAKGALAAAEAKYKSILDGSTSEEKQLAQVALTNAQNDYDRVKSQQEVLVKNAYQNLLNSTIEAKPKSTSVSSSVPVITGTLNKNFEGQINISVYNTNSGQAFNASGLVNASGVASSTTAQPIGDSGLYIKFPASSNIMEWIIDIPNKNASDYLINYNAYQAALKNQDSALGTSQALVNQRQAELSLKNAPATQASIDLAQANILTAQGQVESASANLEHTILRAPADGTITTVDIKVGELAQAQKNVVTLQDINNIYLEANINEANIVNVAVGAPVDVTFDAFSTDQVFKGSIVTIDPSSTVISGVVNYKVKANLIDTPKLRPGMTANMTILVGEKDDVLVVPSRAILKDKSGKKTVRLITNTKTKEYKEVEITTGMEGDGGMTEVVSGLKEGDEVVTLIKK